MSFLSRVMSASDYNIGDTPCIFAGDLNAWHPDLLTGGDDSSNAAGTTLASWLNDENHLLLSDGTPTHFSHQKVGRCIDVWLCNAAASGMIGSAPTTVDYYGSDHLATRLEVNFQSTVKPPKRRDNDEKRLNWNCVNWQALDDRTTCNLATVADPAKPKPGDPLSAIDVYERAIVEAAWAAVLETVPCHPASKINDWKLNREIGDALEARNKLQRLHDKTPIDEVKQAINQMTNTIRRLIGEEEAKLNQKQLEHIAVCFREQQAKQAWEMAARLLRHRRRNRRGIVSLRNEKNYDITSDADKARLIAETFQKVTANAPNTSTSAADVAFWAETDDIVLNSAVFHPLATIPAIRTVKITDETMDIITASLKKWKAPGEDNIPNIVIKCGGAGLRDHLKNLFELSLNTGYVPKAWKTAVVIPIPKEGKDPRMPSSYRPISLLPAFAKMLELLVTRYLADQLNSKGLLAKHQFGFQPNKSTSDPLVRVISDVSIAMARHWKLVAVALDFKAAFDSVWRNGLRRKLLEANLPVSLTRWISGFLDDRTFSVKIGEARSETCHSVCGVPQGSPLSPLLFIFYTAEMQGLDCSPDDASKRVARATYADDAFNWASGKSYALAARRLQDELEKTALWCRKWRLELNAQKCESILFGYYNSVPTLRLEIDGRSIPQVKRIRYLGVILTPQMCWQPHISQLSAKARPRAGAVRRMAARMVLSTDILLLFSRSIIESVLIYAAPAWACRPASSNIRLSDLQNNGVRAALNLPFDTDIAPFLERFNIEDINQKSARLLTNYGLQCLQFNPVMAEYIRYVAKLQFDTFGRKIMEEHCPVWHLKPIVGLDLQPIAEPCYHWITTKTIT